MYLTRILPVAAAIALTACMGSCRSSKPETTAPVTVTTAVKAPMLGGPESLPKARIYKMNVDAYNRVAITVDPTTDALLSFPDPRDITESQRPIPVADGWMLDRRGLNTNSRFTSWTYATYSALPEPPSPAQLMASLTPQVKISEMVQLPMTVQQAVADTAAVNTLIRTGLPGCTKLIP